MLLDAFVALADDYAAVVPAGMNALARLHSDTNPTGETLRWLWQGCVLALELWDDESAYVLSERHLQVARKTGALILYAWQGQAREARELIESAARAGRPDLAADARDRLTRKAQACRTDWALGIEARSRALLSTNAAEPRFRDAIEHLGRARVRAELSLAYDMFTALGVSSRRQLPADAGHGPW